RRLPAIAPRRHRRRRRAAKGNAAQAEQDDDQPHPVPGRGYRDRGPAAVDESLAGDRVVRLNKIYTRTGDDGTSGLVDGSRRPKHDPRFEAIGAVDEANTVLGWANCALAQPYCVDIARIQ